jgi:hypothetical protein
MTELAGGIGLHTGVNTATFSQTTNYAIMVYLPGKRTYLCIGSGGQTSDTTPYPADNWNRPGCWNNP